MDRAHLFDQMTNLDTFMGSENYTPYKVLSGQILDKKMGSLGFECPLRSLVTFGHFYG